MEEASLCKAVETVSGQIGYTTRTIIDLNSNFKEEVYKQYFMNLVRLMLENIIKDKYFMTVSAI